MTLNDGWKEADREAHAAKAEAIVHAIETLEGLAGMVELLTARMIEQALAALNVERDRHELAARRAA